MSDVEGSQAGDRMSEKQEEDKQSTRESTGTGSDGEAMAKPESTLLQQAAEVRVVALEEQVKQMEAEKLDLVTRLGHLNHEHSGLQDELSKVTEKQRQLEESERGHVEEIERLRQQESELQQANERLQSSTVSKELFESLGRRHKDFRDAYLQLINRVKEQDSTDGSAVEPRSVPATVSKSIYDALCRRHAELREECRQLMQGRRAGVGNDSSSNQARISSLMAVENGSGVQESIEESGRGLELEKTWEVNGDTSPTSPGPFSPSEPGSTVMSLASAASSLQLLAPLDSFDKVLDAACADATIKLLMTRTSDKMVETWTEATPLPDKILGKCCATLFKNVFVAGTVRNANSGRKEVRLFQAPPDLSEWTVMTDILPPENAIRPLLLTQDSEHERLILVTLQPDSEPDRVWTKDLSDEAWTLETECKAPVRRRDCTYVLHNRNLLIAAGGMLCDSNEASLNVTVYNMKTKETRRWPSLRSPILQSCVTILEGSVVLLGGYDITRSFYPVTKIRALELRKAESASGKWRTHQSAKSSYGACGAMSTLHHLVVAGGMNNENEAQNSVRVWSSSLKQWAELPPLMQGRAVPELLKVGDSLLCIGGCVANRQYTNTIERLVIG